MANIFSTEARLERAKARIERKNLWVDHRVLSAKKQQEIRRYNKDKSKLFLSILDNASEQGIQAFLLVVFVVLIGGPVALNSFLRWNEKPPLDASTAATITETGKTGIFLIVGNLVKGTVTKKKKLESDGSGGIKTNIDKWQD